MITNEPSEELFEIIKDKKTGSQSKKQQSGNEVNEKLV